MIVRGTLKKYIGAIEDEDVAGVLYDKYAIIIQGIQVSSEFGTISPTKHCSKFCSLSLYIGQDKLLVHEKADS